MNSIGAFNNKWRIHSDLLKGPSNKLWGFKKAWIIIMHIDCIDGEVEVNYCP